jgi:penicillin-binding protein 1A
MAARRRRTRERQGDHRTIAVVAMLAVVVAIVGAAGVAVGGALSAVARDLPKLDIAAHQPLTENTYIYDGSPQPKILAVLRGDQSRVVVGSSRIAPVLKRAVVAVEDRRFYQHKGVDYEGIARALWTDLTAGQAVQGGSTITQQFIKNAYLPEEQRTQESFSRKIREAVLAYQLEKRWSKDKILTDYLNTIYFGHGAYGVEMAARTFFGTSARRLTLAQAALLAGVIRNPSQDDPFLAPASARARRRVVLDAMAAQGMVSTADAAAAARAPLPPHPPSRPSLAPPSRRARPDGGLARTPGRGTDRPGSGS